MFRAQINISTIHAAIVLERAGVPNLQESGGRSAKALKSVQARIVGAYGTCTPPLSVIHDTNICHVNETRSKGSLGPRAALRAQRWLWLCLRRPWRAPYLWLCYLLVRRKGPESTTRILIQLARSHPGIINNPRISKSDPYHAEQPKRAGACRV
jgi:hypothetical protein